MTGSRGRVGAALALVALVVAVLFAGRDARAQANTMIVQVPFSGDSSEALQGTVEDAVHAALLARGLAAPDRMTVAQGMGVATPTDTAGIVGLARSMGGTHALTGEVTALTGQYNLRLRLYEVATGRVAEQYRNVGEGDEQTVVPQMVAALFAPGALRLSPEDQARADALRQQQEAEARARAEADRQAEAARLADAARRRAEDEARRRAEADRARRIYRFAEGGVISAGASLLVGGRISDPAQRPSGAPPADALVGALRLEGGYAVLPAVGLELGGAALVVLNPTEAFSIGPSLRISLPPAWTLPIRGGAGVAGGLFQELSGARATTAWLSFDVRAEFDVVPAVTLYVGLELDSVPGALGWIVGVGGVRFHFGEPSPAPPRH